MVLNLIHVLDLLVIFVSLLFAGFLLLSNSVNYRSNALMGMYLVLNSIDAGQPFILNYIFPKHPGFGMLLSTTVFFKAPLIYLYILSIIHSDFKLCGKHWLHTLPFLAAVLVLVPRFYSVDFDAKWVFLRSANMENIFEMRFSYLLIHLVVISYLIASFLAIRRYKHLLLENYSSASLMNYRWLFQLVSIIALATVISSLKNVAMFLSFAEPHYYLMLLTSIVELGFISWIVIKALQDPELFKGIDSSLQLVKDISDENEERGSLDPEARGLLERIDNFMKKEEPYLHSSLTVVELAEMLDMESQTLSVLINRGLNKHFFDFVNGYRIEKAKQMLLDPRTRRSTVLEILYQVGFNSKSSFNTAFKKYTHTTPTAYRKQNLEQA